MQRSEVQRATCGGGFGGTTVDCATLRVSIGVEIMSTWVPRTARFSFTISTVVFQYNLTYYTVALLGDLQNDN